MYSIITKFAIILLAIPGFAIAAPQTWFIPLTSLSNGTAISGSFTYDPITQTASNANIVATGTLPKNYTYIGTSFYLPGDLVFQANQIGTLNTPGEAIIISVPQLIANQYVISNITTFDCTGYFPSGSGLCYAQSSVSGSATNVVVSDTPPAPAAIPTLGEWAMIFMASLMAMFGIRRMRRSK